jgi:DNA-directed RNA polymerase sigma subunit (sigma70/sigma32)
VAVPNAGAVGGLVVIVAGLLEHRQDLLADYALLFSHTRSVDRELPPDVNTWLAALSDTQRRAVVLRFGLDDDLPRTFEQMAQRLGCSAFDARDAVASAMEHLASRP